MTLPKRGPSLTFGLDTVLRAVVMSFGVGVTVITTTSGLRSDVRDILTRMASDADKRTMQERLVEERFRLMSESLAPMGETMNEHKRLIALLQYEVNALKTQR